MNLRSLPGLDFSASFLNSASVEAAAGGFNSYAVSGYAGIDPYSLPAVFFNKSLVSGIGRSSGHIHMGIDVSRRRRVRCGICIYRNKNDIVRRDDRSLPCI